jgi:phospholipase/lecithinase/hemolysin
MAIATIMNRRIGNITGFAYSDNFHPTPRGHEVAGQVALNLMNAKGWVAR